jgi:ubiquinone/menaquinone biosynthesis C-methylase UbiE
MSVWGRLFPVVYDRMIASTEKAGLGAHRKALLDVASGDVLEIGGGTGANLPFYGDGVLTLTVTEPERPMIRRLERRLQQDAPDALFLRAPAEDLPFEDASFDTVVSTLVLCTVDDQPRALRELWRVLRPGGSLLFIEHVRSEDPKLARWQDRVRPLNARIGCGCQCNRATLDGITGAGFEVRRLVRDRLRHAGPFISPLIVGAAERAAA